MMSANRRVPWSEVTGWRDEAAERWGPIHEYPRGWPYDEIEERLDNCHRILDVGAGADKPLQSRYGLKEDRYFSLDIDPMGDFDFNSIKEIPDGLGFDLAWSNQVIEHLEISDAVELVEGVRSVLDPGGTFIATTPNAAHPTRFWGDPTHSVAWNAGDYYGLFRTCGFEDVEIVRYNKFPLTRNPIKRVITWAVCDVFRVDWCDGLMAIAEREH